MLHIIILASCLIILIAVCLFISSKQDKDTTTKPSVAKRYPSGAIDIEPPIVKRKSSVTSTSKNRRRRRRRCNQINVPL